ncbi:hypothetical protein WICPIJ_008888 [Wickerhamomyces pijperi]|uniref:Uncharacterized protein n=1 Tax=Wickerhamomyces pijperi TaxID=599730 RepID=A0A9P8PTR2_WICPI|nr:hypothetical protein WICPIJ_008888 [Wickerhamomyces pijperi]
MVKLVSNLNLKLFSWSVKIPPLVSKLSTNLETDNGTKNLTSKLVDLFTVARIKWVLNKNAPSNSVVMWFSVSAAQLT